MPRFICSTILVFSLVSISALIAQDAPPKSQLEKTQKNVPVDEDVLGKWERLSKTKHGNFRIVKEHRENKTWLTIFDSDENIVQEKVSKYKIDTAGNIRKFTYFDNKFLTGLNRGASRAEESSYVYRIQDDNFFEIRGLLINDPGPVSVIVWKRIKE